MAADGRGELGVVDNYNGFRRYQGAPVHDGVILFGRVSRCTGRSGGCLDWRESNQRWLIGVVAYFCVRDDVEFALTDDDLIGVVEKQQENDENRVDHVENSHWDG